MGMYAVLLSTWLIDSFVDIWILTISEEDSQTNLVSWKAQSMISRQLGSNSHPAEAKEVWVWSEHRWETSWESPMDAALSAVVEERWDVTVIR